MKDRNDLEGGCACGHIRYRLTSEPMVVHACHCRFCQRMSGSLYGVNAMIEADRVRLVGEGRPAGIHTPSTRPEGQEWMRCPKCFVAVWSHHPALGKAIALVQAGTLDHPETISPTVHCFTATRHPRVTIPDDVPAFEGDYDSETVWSAEAKARIGAALG